MSLSPVHKAFVAEYIKNGYNATQAYLAVRPGVTYTTAATTGAQYLGNPHIKEAIDRQVDKRINKSVASRDHLIQEAHDILGEARADKHYQTALNAVEVKAKLNRLYDKAEPDTDGYIKLVQMLQVNVTVAQDQPDNTINITPDDRLSTDVSEKE